MRTPLGIPAPEDADPIDAGHQQLRALAEAIDAQAKSIDATAAQVMATTDPMLAGLARSGPVVQFTKDGAAPAGGYRIASGTTDMFTPSRDYAGFGWTKAEWDARANPAFALIHTHAGFTPVAAWISNVEPDRPTDIAIASVWTPITSEVLKVVIETTLQPLRLSWVVIGK